MKSVGWTPITRSIPDLPMLDAEWVGDSASYVDEVCVQLSSGEVFSYDCTQVLEKNEENLHFGFEKSSEAIRKAGCSEDAGGGRVLKAERCKLLGSKCLCGNVYEPRKEIKGSTKHASRRMNCSHGRSVPGTSFFGY